MLKAAAHSLSYAAAAAAGLLLASCVPLLNLAVPRAGYSIRSDVAYGNDPRQKLDVYVPDGLKAPAPVLIFF